MATNQWIGVSGDWSTPSDWSADAVPGPSDDAVIAAPGSYTVTVTTPQAVGSVLLDDPGAILDISTTTSFSPSIEVQSGTLEIDRLATLANGGSLDVQSDGTLFINAGTIEGGSLIINQGGTLESSDFGADKGDSSKLQNVTVFGGLTLNSGALALTGNTTIENSDGTGPGAITLNGSSLIFGKNYTVYSLTLNGGSVIGGVAR
jgi:hypothetical protein